MTNDESVMFSFNDAQNMLQPIEYNRRLKLYDTIHADELIKRPIHHIAFLKVHKAASSTAQNIFLRYGWNRNLTFVLPPVKNPSGHPNIISLTESLTNSNILPPPNGHQFDILCNHVLYNRKTFKQFMPNDTVFIGIIREPYDLFKSTLNYMNPAYIFKRIKSRYPVSTFLRNPSIYEPKRLEDSWTNNRMSIEYGFPKKLFEKYNQTEIDTYLNKLNTEFKVILIAEYMEESVIIMRRFLNWKTSDIIYLDQNIAHNKNETRLSRTFDRDFYKSYAKLDYALYDFFYKRMREHIRHEGADFDDELINFQELRKMVAEYCKQNEVHSPLLIDATRWNERFNITKATCHELQRGEMAFIQQIRLRQYGRKDI